MYFEVTEDVNVASNDSVVRNVPLGESVTPTDVVLPGSISPFPVVTFLRRETRWAGIVPPALLSPPNKPALEFEGQPMWHEFIVLTLLRRDGWEGVWTKNFGGAAFWTAPSVEMAIPSEAMEVFEGLKKIVGKGGFWDVFAWRDEVFLFVESKQRAKDKLRENQLRWLEGGLQADCQIGFAIAEYTLT